jgi:hypothetical protein
VINTTDLQRYDYYRGAVLLGDLWMLQRGALKLRCAISTNKLGWELRLTAGQNFLRSQICKSEGEVASVSEAWIAEAKSKGWADVPA